MEAPFRNPRTRSLLRAAGFAGLLALAIVPRILFLSRWQENFDADEALVGVEAREILHGRYALFIPGQSYMGALQATLAAPWVALLGNHATAVRLSPLLWVIPGWLALVALDARRRSEARSQATRAPSPVTARCGHGERRFWLAFAWILPPAVLWLAGLKARGGNLEGLVLGLWAAALAWPEAAGNGSGSAAGDERPDAKAEDPQSRRARGRRVLRVFGAGVVFGLGVWTHESVALLAPLLLVLALAGRPRWLRLAGGIAGSVVGYLPLWLPKLAPFGLGPPGTEGVGETPHVSALFTAEAVRRLPAALLAALTTRTRLSGVEGAFGLVYTLLALAACAAALYWWLRPPEGAKDRAVVPGRRPVLLDRARGPLWRADPPLVVTLWLAAGTTVAILGMPVLTEDPQWFRYALGICPFLVVAQAAVLCRLRRPAAWAGAGLLALFSMIACLRATPAWEYPRSRERAALVGELERRGVTRAQSQWELCYNLRFLSGDRILASCATPPRFPEVESRVDYAAEQWTVALRAHPPRQRRTDGTWTALDEVFQISPHAPPPPEARAAFDSLDLSRTLFAHFEPFPLLPEGSTPRDWRGWPYRRALSRFDAIVWNPQCGQTCPAPPERVEAALRAAVERGEFIQRAEWARGRIYRRVRQQ